MTPHANDERQRLASGPRLKDRASPVLVALVCALSFGTGFWLGPGRISPSGGHAQGSRAAHTHAAPAVVGVPGLPGTPAWRAEAQANLTMWRSTLLERTMELLKQTAHAASPHAQLQPQAHARYDLFSSILTCPRGEALSRVGGGADGGKLVRLYQEVGVGPGQRHRSESGLACAWAAAGACACDRGLKLRRVRHAGVCICMGAFPRGKMHLWVHGCRRCGMHAAVAAEHGRPIATSPAPNATTASQHALRCAPRCWRILNVSSTLWGPMVTSNLRKTSSVKQPAGWVTPTVRIWGKAPCARVTHEGLATRAAARALR